MDDGLPSPSRPPPPTVAPVEHRGVRYTQDLDHAPRQRDQGFGYLLAVDPASDEVLWEIKVYEGEPAPGLETDVQEVYFASMELVPGRDELLIENEIGGRYLVDLERRSVRPEP